MKTTIIGAGSWGTALAISTAQAFGESILFVRDEKKAIQIKDTRENIRLPGITIPKTIFISSDPKDLSTCDLLIIATPAQFMREQLILLHDYLPKNIPGLIAAKGIEQNSHYFMTDVLREVAPGISPFVLSGPSFAADLAKGLPVAISLAGESANDAMQLSKSLTTHNFRVYPGTDLRGVEFGGSFKNVIAIACGIAEGLELGKSALAALVTRGFAEMMRVGLAFGAKPETLSGLSGLGDLLLTSSSHQSRNFSLGVRLAKGNSQRYPINGVTEGAWTAPVITEMARNKSIEMPIADAVCRVLANEGTANEEVRRLLSRPVKFEI